MFRLFRTAVRRRTMAINLKDLSNRVAVIEANALKTQAGVQTYIRGAGTNNVDRFGGQPREHYDCGGTCSWTCSSCSGGCSGSASGSCGSSCSNSCTAGCTSACTGCSGGCTSACTGCSGTCTGGCSGNCSGSCSGGCSGCTGHR